MKLFLEKNRSIFSIIKEFISGRDGMSNIVGVVGICKGKDRIYRKD